MLFIEAAKTMRPMEERQVLGTWIQRLPNGDIVVLPTLSEITVTGRIEI
jgi:hypothetical protein